MTEVYGFPQKSKYYFEGGYMKNLKRSLASLLALVMLIAIFPFASLAEPSLPYDSSVKTSLLKNYTTDWFGSSQDWTAPNNPTYERANWSNNYINTLNVASDGSVIVYGGWDESLMEVSIYKDGKRTGSVAGTHYGGANGLAVTNNDKYIWVSLTLTGSDATTPVGAAIKKASIDGKITYPMIHLTSFTSIVSGLAAFGTNLYVADSGNGKVYVYDVETNEKKTTEFNVTTPGKMVTDTNGNLWIISGANKVLKYSSTGSLLATLTLGANIVPKGLDFYNGKIYVADGGVAQNVKIYDENNLNATPSTFGVNGGIYASAIPGTITDKHFYFICDVGLDSQGNIYVGMSSPSTDCRVESYGSDGNKKWEMFGAQFLNSGSIDPATDSGTGDTSFDVYSTTEVFTKDASMPSGKGWKYKAVTLDPFKYPDDIRITGNDEYGISTSWIRYINGVKFLFVTDMYTTNLAIFRFETNSEIAIPCGIIAKQGRKSTNILWKQIIPTGGSEWMWIDNNADGFIDATEIITNTYGPLSSGWCIDGNGNIWQPQSSGQIRKFPFEGFTTSGVPKYSFTTIVTETAPAVTKNSGGTENITQLMRAEYDSTTDDMILSGYTPSTPNTKGYWKVIGVSIIRFSNWSKATRKQEWRVDMDTTGKEYNNYIASMAIAGDYVFLGYRNDTRIEIYNRNTGSAVGYMLPGPEIGGMTEGWLDIGHALVAQKMKDGSYAIFSEEMFWGSILMFKWNGDPSLTTRPANPVLYKFECLKKSSSGTIVVDGNINDTEWTRAMTNKASKVVLGVNNNTVSYKTMWDLNYLYVAVTVLDDVLMYTDTSNSWDNDALEICIDGDNDRGGFYNTKDNQFIYGYNFTDAKFFIQKNPGIKANIKRGFKVIQGGYTIEMAFPWADMGGVTPGNSKLMGFDIANDDDDDGVAREGMLIATGANYVNNGAFGEMKLVTTLSTKLSTLPTNFTSPKQTETTVDLTWAATANAYGYNIYNGLVKLNHIPYLTTKATLTELTPNTNYNLTLYPLSSAGEGTSPATLSVTTAGTNPSPTPTPVPTQGVTPTPVPTQTVTPTPVPTQGVTPTPVPTQGVTPTPVPTQTVTPTPEITPEPTPATSGYWEESDGKWYYWLNDELVTGWQTIDGKKYYFNTSGGARFDSGWAVIEDTDSFKTYYFNSDGTVKTGLFTDGGNLYFLDPNNNGVLADGLFTVDGDLYFFDYYSDSVAVKDSLIQIGNNYYYFGSDYKAVKNQTVQIGGQDITFDENGYATNYSPQTNDPTVTPVPEDNSNPTTSDITPIYFLYFCIISTAIIVFLKKTKRLNTEA